MILFNELNKIITTVQWFCCSVLLVKTEGPAVSAWESAVCQLLFPNCAEPSSACRLALSQCGTAHPACDADVTHTRSFMCYNICLGSQQAAVDWLLIYKYICYAHRKKKKSGLFSSSNHRNSNKFCSLDPFLVFRSVMFSTLSVLTQVTPSEVSVIFITYSNFLCLITSSQLLKLRHSCVIYWDCHIKLHLSLASNGRGAP